jgi:hypothetical protein
MTLSVRKISMAIALAPVPALPLLGKVTVDFDPNVDFSKYKTFAYIGGVENLVNDAAQSRPHQQSHSPHGRAGADEKGIA